MPDGDPYVPSTGVRCGESPNGSFTWEPLTPVVDVVPPAVSLDGLLPSVPVCSVASDCVRSTSADDVPVDESDSVPSSDRSDPTPFGSKPVASAPASAAPGDGLFCPATRAGASRPELTSFSTSTASASAHGSPRTAATFELSHDHELRCVQSAFAKETSVNSSMITDTTMIDGERNQAVHRFFDTRSSPRRTSSET
ncbi:Uncharacterised protein [Mycobacteroides abscessus subsp. abscessus]|nr:Uncharacterised protein [Mycobacteroides abscessus subsp. abscessus]